MAAISWAKVVLALLPTKPPKDPWNPVWWIRRFSSISDSNNSRTSSSVDTSSPLFRSSHRGALSCSRSDTSTSRPASSIINFEGNWPSPTTLLRTRGWGEPRCEEEGRSSPPRASRPAAILCPSSPSVRPCFACAYPASPVKVIAANKAKIVRYAIFLTNSRVVRRPAKPLVHSFVNSLAGLTHIPVRPIVSSPTVVSLPGASRSVARGLP